jgi:hypothetical protein
VSFLGGAMRSRHRRRGWCQTNANQSHFSSAVNVLGCAEATPLDQSSAAHELERSRLKLRLNDGDSFVELLLDNYAKLSPR